MMTMTAYSIFVKLCREEHEKMFGDKLLDQEMFERKTAERWRTMTEREKVWFVQEELKARRGQSPIKSSTPLRPSPKMRKSEAKSLGRSSTSVPSNLSNYNPYERKKLGQPSKTSQQVRGSGQTIGQMRSSLNLEPLKPQEHLTTQPRKLSNQSYKPRMSASQDSKVRDV